jgi:hypothetical protein
MNDHAYSLDELMHAVLDGEASPQQALELEQLLSADPGARRKFEDLRGLLRVLSGAPRLEPPAQLLDDALTRFDAFRAQSAAPRQLFPKRDVFLSRAQNAGQQRSPISIVGEFLQSMMEFSMNNKQRRVVIVAGALVAIAAAVVISQNFPPTDKNTSGTIVPADRYRAPQATADDVGGGGTSGTSTGTAGPTAGSAEASLKEGALKETGLKETGLKETGLKETGLKETGLKETGLKETGLKETGLKETGLKETGLKETGLKETGLKETGLKETGLKETGLKETGLKETGLKETGVKETGNGGGG